jgi:hypothetical protein
VQGDAGPLGVRVYAGGVGLVTGLGDAIWAVIPAGKRRELVAVLGVESARDKCALVRSLGNRCTLSEPTHNHIAGRRHSSHMLH